MINNIKHLTIKNKMMLLGIGVAVLWWFLETAMDVIVFQQGRFVERMFPADPNELWMRLVAASLFVGFGMYVGLAMDKLMKMSERLRASNQQLRANDQQLKAANQQLNASNQQLDASNQQLRASEQQLRANDQQLKAANQQLDASNQQLRASEQQLRANDQQLKAANQQLDASNQQLRASEQQLNALNQQLRTSEEGLKKSNHSLGGRVKELNCLYGLSQLTERGDIALEEIFQGLAELMPPSWQYPEITCGRVIFERTEFKTDNFRETKWKQSTDISVNGKKAGAIEVYYLEERPTLDEGPFLKEERNLIDGLSHMLREAIGRKRAEDTLREAYDELEQRVQERTADLTETNEKLLREIRVRKQAEKEIIVHREQLRSLASQLSITEEQTKKYIAEQLHDDALQTLVFLKMQFEELREPGLSSTFTKTLNRMDKETDDLIQRLRVMTFDLSSPLLYELGLSAAIEEWLTQEIQEKHKISTKFEDDGKVKLLDEDLGILLYRAVRELLANVVKHAGAKNVKVCRKQRGKQIVITVEDDGKGFNNSEQTLNSNTLGGFGLFSISERLRQYNGNLEIVEIPTGGTRVIVTAMLLK